MNQRNPSRQEFIALVALLFSMVAFATDAMLPSLAEISTDLALENVNHAQLVITVFVLGTGMGQLVTGPLSDSFGRKMVICLGIVIFLFASLWAFFATSMTELMIARFVQGLGVSAPRTVTHALVRDLYSGRQMARIVSFAMMLFVLVPAVAPLIGQTIMLALGWRYIFAAFQIVAVIAIAWLYFRQPETHSPDKRRPFRPREIMHAAQEVVTNRRVVISMGSLSLGLACIFSYLLSAQQIYVVWLKAGHDFPLYFALTAIIAGSASFLNAFLVVRVGMLWLSTIGYAAIFVSSLGFGAVVALELVGLPNLLWLFVAWSTAMFFLLGLCIANLNALALEPMGHVAGMASAVIGSIATVVCIVLAFPVGQMFDGTGLPLVVGVALCAGTACLMNLLMRRHPLQSPVA